MWSLFFALIAGAFLPLAFAPFGIYTFAFICPAVLCYLWINSSPWQAWWRGLFFGIGFFAVGVSWVFISINTYGNTPAAISVLVTLLFILLLALFPGTQGLVTRLIFKNRSKTLQCLCIFPATWVLWEMIRVQFITGFPWLLLGYSQLHTPLRGLGPIFGVYGISLAVAVISGCLALLACRNSRLLKFGCVVLIIFVILLGWIFQNRIWTKAASTPIQVSLIQGNIPQEVKWDPKQLIKTLQIYHNLTEKSWFSHLIIWPEAAVPAIPQELSGYLDDIDREAKAHHAFLVFGAPIYNPSTKHFYNGLMIIGEGQGSYLKRHLVPFGEYLPWKSAFNWFINYFQVPMSDLAPGPKIQPELHADHFTFSTFICYEIAFPTEVLNFTKNRNMIIAIIDDSWFGKSIALAQHLQMSQMRALELGRYVLQATNTGISAIINPMGKLVATSPLNREFVLSAEVMPMSGNTPLMKWNYYPVFIIIVILLLLSAFLRTKKEKS